MPTGFISKIPELGQIGAFQISLDGVTELEGALRKYKSVAIPEIERAMKRSLDLAYRTIIPMMPEDTGASLKSLYKHVSSTGDTVTGTFGSDLDYVAALEFGREPGHRPPKAPLELWAQRHGLPKGSGWAIVLKIEEHGLPAHKMFERTMEQIQPQVDAYFAEAIERTIDKVLSERAAFFG